MRNAQSTVAPVTDTVVQDRTGSSDPEWHRAALIRMAQTMTCSKCGVVGLRLEWKGDRGVYSCDACGSPSMADLTLQG